MLKAEGDYSHITLIFNKMSSSGPKTTTQNGQASYNGAWTNGKIFANHVGTSEFDYNGKHYKFLYWEDEAGNHYLSTDKFSAPGNGSDYTLVYNAVYAISPSEVTVIFNMESADGPVKENITRSLASGGSTTVSMDVFNEKIAPYKQFDVEDSEGPARYTFDHWEDEAGNIIDEDQVLTDLGRDYTVKYTAIYNKTVPTSNVTVIFKKQNADGEVITNESNVLNPGMTWTSNSTTFATQISGYEEFDINKVHYEFSHWEDEEGNEVTDPQTFVWTGEDYTKTFIAKYDGIAPATVTVIFNNMSAGGSVSANESNDIYQGNTWTINMTSFDNKIANYRNFTYEGKFYNFSHWIDKDGNEVTEPQTFSWAEENYTVTYTAVYDAYDVSNVTIIFANMSTDGNKISMSESNILGPGVSWTINQTSFDNKIANYRYIEDDNGVRYNFTQWVDEDGNPVTTPITFNWNGKNQTYTYYAQYKLTKPSNVTIYWIRMSSSGENIYNDSSNIIAINDNWAITEGKFNNRIYGFTDFYYNGAHYKFNHWENETCDAVTEQIFFWTGEDYNRTFTAIYDIYPDCNITVIWNMMDANGDLSTNDSKIVRHPYNWTVPLSTFDSKIASQEFHYNGAWYVFNHWENETSDTVDADQVLPWAEENYTRTYTAVYDIYPDCDVNVVWNMMGSDGELSTGDSQTLIYNTNWTVTMDTFDKQLAEKEFNYSGYHYVFNHWENETADTVDADQVLPWKGEAYTRTYTAVYDKTLILKTTVSNESASGKPGKNVTVDFTVNDENDDPVPNGTLTVTVGDKNMLLMLQMVKLPLRILFYQILLESIVMR